MARGWNSWAKIKAYGPAHCRLTKESVARVCEEVLTLPYDEIREISRDPTEVSLISILARSVVTAKQSGDFQKLDRILDRVVGKVNQNLTLIPSPSLTGSAKVSFADFCERAGYPRPYEKQEQMREFAMTTPGVKLILGARGYGKTDYTVILGSAYEIYLTPDETTFLIITKSRERNASIVSEIGKALAANGVGIEQENASVLRTEGLHGKDHSVSTVTIGAVSLRGRHPKKIIMDDPVTEDDVSEATRKRVQRVYNEAVKLASDMLIIGQPVHKFDLYETLRPLVKSLEFPFGSIPELDHDIEAQRLAGVSEESIQSSYFLKVISESGFPMELVGSLPNYPVGDSVAFMDPAYEGSDYTALSIGRMHIQGVAVKGRLWRRPWYNCIDEVCEELTACGVRKLCFETNMVGDQPVQLLREVVPEGIQVIGKTSLGNKHSRIAAAGPFASSIFIAETSDTLYKSQVRKYEYGAKHDDGPDSLASLLEWIGLIRGKTTK